MCAAACHEVSAAARACDMVPHLEPRRPPLQGNRLWSGLSILSKRSFRSFATSSFEADDERSSTDGAMSPGSEDSDGFGRSLEPRYSGHDARPTSRKELAGWYTYAFAAETYMICGIGTRLPRLLRLIELEALIPLCSSYDLHSHRLFHPNSTRNPRA